MRYILLFITLCFIFSTCETNPERKDTAHSNNDTPRRLFDSGDTVIASGNLSTGKMVTPSGDKVVWWNVLKNGDTAYTVITQEQKTFTYNERSIDTFTKKYSGGVVNPPPVEPPPTHPGVRNNIIFTALFNGSNPFDVNNFYKHACCSYTVTQSKTIVKEGDGSYRAEVKSSDPSVSGGYRAELTTPPGSNLKEAWFGYSSYFQDWNSFSGGEHVVQWHPNNASGSAELSLQTAANKFDVVRSIGGTNYRQSTGVKTIIPNKWYDFVWHVKWSTGNDGIIELWIDGVKYYTFTGKTAGSSTPYFKFGINRWNMGNSSRVLFYDNLRIGNEKATYKDVAP